MSQQTYLITFEGISPADAQRYTEELRSALLNAVPDITVQRRREHPYTPDFSATPVLTLGTPTVIAIVRAVGDWLMLRNRASLTWKNADERLSILNITSKNATEFAQFLLSRP